MARCEASRIGTNRDVQTLGEDAHQGRQAIEREDRSTRVGFARERGRGRDDERIAVVLLQVDVWKVQREEVVDECRSFGAWHSALGNGLRHHAGK